jgi:two-component system chemotaxis response regulator CheB
MPAEFRPEIVCIGGSTGAPTVLVEVLSRLPGDYPFPIVVAQHIARGFASGLASWLDSSVSLDVRLASPGDKPAPGLVLIAPDDHHMEIALDRQVRMISPANPQEHIPSVDTLFESAARVYGKAALGVLLSGMGRDGAQGITSMYLEGAVTLAQDEATSVVFGMAKVAVEAGVIMKTVSPRDLAELLLRLAR